MLTRYFKLSTIFQICLLLLGAAVSAQDTPGQWVGDLYRVNSFSSSFQMSSVLIDENNRIHRIIPDFAIEKNFFRQREYFSHPTWHNGVLYVVAPGSIGKIKKNEDVPGTQRWTFAKWQDGVWHPLGHYKVESNGNLLKAIPCSDGRFIVVFCDNEGMDTESRSKTTPFHLMSVRPGQTEFSPGFSPEFSIVESIDHGQAALPMAMPNYFWLAYWADIIMTDRHATLLSKDTGLYWVFSLENASLVKAGNIFKEKTARMVLTGGFANSPILCANPEKNGTILIAAQEDVFFTTETKSLEKETDRLLNTKPYRRMPMEEFNAKVYAPLEKEFADRSPIIVWYRLYPETGKVENLKVPPAGGSDLREGGKNDIWRPMPDGSVGKAPGVYSLGAEVERRLKNKIADFSPETVRAELASLLLAKFEKQISAEFQKRLKDGDTDFSLLKAEVERQLRLEVEKLLKDNPDPSFRAAVAEAESQIKNNIAEAEIAIKRSVAKGQGEIK